MKRSSSRCAARLLEQFFRNYDDRERIASQLRDAEHAGDQISHTIGIIDEFKVPLWAPRT